jgi:hypothetical protein
LEYAQNNATPTGQRRLVMPLAFPSHQGLIVPLWRRFPDHFSVLALYVGAGIPDAVDGSLAPFRGGLGQWYGHTLLGSFVFCIPLGLVVTWLCLVLGRKISRTAWGRWAGNGIVSSCSFPPGLSRAGRILLVVWSLWIATLTHDLIDFVTHTNFIFFYPWYENKHFFPEWWSREWFTIGLPGYAHPYSVGWHLVVWLVLSVLGILMFLRSIGLTAPRPARASDERP